MAVPLGILLLWLGYSLGYYGYNRITGGNDKFISLIYPGRWKPVQRDGGASPGVAGTGALNPAPQPGAFPNAPSSPTQNPTNPTGAV